VLPWRGARATWPDEAPDTAARTGAALARLRPALATADTPVIWGGDWNHAMSGTERAGSAAGRRAIAALVADLGLAVPTGDRPHRIEGVLSIDRIAVPATWAVASCRRAG
jgi:hypothetical protein